MPTDKPRLNITITSEIEGIIAQMADRHELSKSAMARRLLETAIEYDEDYHMSRIAMERDTEDAVFISEEEFWNEALQD